MKKILIVLLALAFPAGAWSMDISQGKIEVTGTTSFNFTSNDYDSGNDRDTLSLEVDGQYYFQKNIALGGVFTYEDTDADGGDSTAWFVGPQATYNHSINEKVSLFLNGAVGYANQEWDGLDADGYGFRVGGGAKIFLASNIAIVAQLKYTWLTLDPDRGDDVDVDSVNLGLGLSFLF